MLLNQLLRGLARRPLFAGIAVFTLAIGIGANTAIFSVIEGVLLKPLPYPHSDELVALDHAAPGINLARTGAAPFQYFVYREEGRVFQDVGLWNTGTVSVNGVGDPEEVRTLFVTDGVLPILGAQYGDDPHGFGHDNPGVAQEALDFLQPDGVFNDVCNGGPCQHTP